MKQLIESLDSVLGPSQTRYLSYGFSRFHFKVLNFHLEGPHRMLGSICVQYDGPERPPQQPLHIGSIEYLAMGLFLAEGILIKQVRLTRHEINRSLLKRLSIHIKRSQDLNPHVEVPFAISIVESYQDLHSINIGLTSLQLKIQDAEIRIDIDHPGPTQIDFRDFELWPFSSDSLHQDLYRFRELELEHIQLDQTEESISAQLLHPQAYGLNTWGFSAYDNPLSPLDSVRISGQLMQVLLYALISSNRKECPNIWLRSMDIDFKRPYRLERYRVDLQFNQRQQTILRGRPWQTISLSSQIGNMNANFKICHEMP